MKKLSVNSILLLLATVLGAAAIVMRPLFDLPIELNQYIGQGVLVVFDALSILDDYGVISIRKHLVD